LHPTNLERHSVLLREQANQQLQVEQQMEEAQMQQLEQPPPGLEEQGMIDSEVQQ
jgi:cell division protein FtsB